MSANELLQLILFLTTGISLAVGFTTLRKRQVAGSREFSILMFAISWWALCDAIQYFYSSVPVKVFLAQLSYAGIVISPLAWVTFIFTYSQVKLRIPRWLYWTTPTVCIAFFVAVMTNDLHHMVYNRSVLEEADHFGVTHYYGPLFWFWVAVSYVCLLSGTLRLILTALRSVSLFRTNMVLIILGALFPWIGNILYISGLNPIVGFDPTPVGFTLTGIIGLVIIFRQRLFDFVPLAYHTLFTNLSEAVLVLDWQENILDANTKARRMVRQKTLKNRSFRDFYSLLHQESNPRLKNYFTFQGTEGPELEIVLPGPTWFQLKGRRLGDDKQEKRGFLLSIQDITLWKKNQEKLEKNGQLLGLCARFAEEMIKQRDWEQVFREYSIRFQSMCVAQGNFIYPNADYREEFSKVISPESRLWQALWDNKLKKAGVASDQLPPFLEMENDSFAMLPIVRHEEQIGHWVFLWTDKKDLPDTEELDILRLASGILSSALEHQKAQESLILAKEQAESANRAKSDFLSVMSHEIRTPLNAVYAISHMLKEENGDNALGEKIDTLYNSSENLLLLVNDILDYSKIEAGKLELVEQTFSPDQLIGSLIEENNYQAQERKNTLEYVSELTSGQGYIGDRLRLGQVLNNLISNAVKFTTAGNILVSAKVMEQRAGTDLVRISIKDNGGGIDPAFMPYLFDKFSQANTANTRIAGGTGLGLAICKRLLLLMGSELKVDSKLDEGSVFWFDIELKRSVLTSEDAGNHESPDGEGKLRGMHVLLAEDNKVNVFVCKNFLGKWEVTCEVAENGEEAVKMAREGNYDCILMDIQMPVMDGYRATMEIRKFNATIPIIALTASALLDKKEKMLISGMNGFIPKPFRPDEFYQTLLKAREGITD